MKERITFISTDLDQFGKKLKLVIALHPSVLVWLKVGSQTVKIITFATFYMLLQVKK